MTKRVMYKATVTALLVGLTAGPVVAQPYSGSPYPRQAPYQSSQYADNPSQSPTDEAYRAGYRAGYQAGRQRARYDDQPVSSNYDGGADPAARWRQRYGQTYSYNDDRYYQECRNKVDPAGVIAGALIGGLLGNSIGRGGGRTGAAVAGVVVGGALGASLTKRLDCGDRSYAYKTYYDGFNSGRSNSDWQWDNPDNGHYGDFRVRDYYVDNGGFRCANFTQQIYIDREPEVSSGRACQQPDGTWAVVN
jgi:surface antigen